MQNVFFFFVSVLILLSGCQSQPPANPFALNRTVVPPPATFSSQPQYLGQASVTLSPQTPAAVYPSSVQPPPIDPLPSTNTPPQNTNNEKASVYSDATLPEESWAAADVAVTNQTAIQSLEAKTNAVFYQDSNGVTKTTAGSQDTATSSGNHVTTIKE